MKLHPFPERSLVRWRRTDTAGSEDARVEHVNDRWVLSGQLDVAESGHHTALRYRIDCDNQWRTRAALIEGYDRKQPVRLELLADGEGSWSLDGHPVPVVDGAIDVDLGFTPMTNTLPLRRLDLDVGARARVRSAWLRFPEWRLEALDQTYFREAEQRFRYDAIVDGEPFRATLDTAAIGRVLRYENLWEAVFTDPPTA